MYNIKYIIGYECKRLVRHYKINQAIQYNRE